MAETPTQTAAIPAAFTAPIPRGQSLIPSRTEINILRELANDIIDARMPLPSGVTSAQAVYARMLYGREKGFTPMVSLYEIHFIEGRPSIPPLLMVGRVKESGLGEIRTLVSTDERAEVIARRFDQPDESIRFIWTMDKAKRADLLTSQGGKNKKNWKCWPEAMLLARCRSEAYRAVFAELAAGVGYTPDELGADTDAEGRPIEDVQFTPTASTTGVTMKPVEKLKPIDDAAAGESGSDGDGPATVDASSPAEQAAASQPPAGAAMGVTTPADERSWMLSRVKILVSDVLKLSAFDWTQLRHRWRPADGKNMTLPEIQALLDYLGTLDFLNWLRGELKIPDDAWGQALQRRGAMKLTDLTAEAAKEFADKLNPRVTPFSVAAHAAAVAAFFDSKGCGLATRPKTADVATQAGGTQPAAAQPPAGAAAALGNEQ